MVLSKHPLSNTAPDSTSNLESCDADDVDLWGLKAKVSIKQSSTFVPIWKAAGTKIIKHIALWL